jgi:hypothetical protein
MYEMTLLFIERELGVTFILVGLAIFVILTSLIKKVQNQRHTKIINHGIESEATVLAIGPTGSYVNNLPQLKVQMQVEPKKGRNFVAEVKQVVPQVDFNTLHSGTRIVVKYHPSHPKEVILVRTI